MLWLIICQFFSSDRGKGALLFNAFAGCDPPCEYPINFTLQKLECLSYLMLKTTRSHLHLSGQNTGMWRTNRRNNGLAITVVGIASSAGGRAVTMGVVHGGRHAHNRHTWTLASQLWPESHLQLRSKPRAALCLSQHGSSARRTGVIAN